MGTTSDGLLQSNDETHATNTSKETRGNKMNTQIKEDMDKELHLELAELEARITYPLDRGLEEDILEVQNMIRQLENSFTAEEKLDQAVTHYSAFKRSLLGRS